MTIQLPPTHRAIVQRIYVGPLQVEAIPTPQPTPGSAIIRVLAANVVSSSAIGRVAIIGPDATSLAPGQLVFVDCVIRGRNDPSAISLSGMIEGGSEGSRKLMRGEWRDSTYAVGELRAVG